MKKTKANKKDSPEGDPALEREVAAVDDLDSDTATSDTAALRAKVEKLEDALLRARADYQNFQRRAAVERSEAIRYANAGLMKSLLGVLDDLERAMSSPSGETGAVDEGVRLVYENLLKALRDHGLETISADNEPFDPSVHEALMQQPSADHPSGTILEEFAKGYRLRDRVLRPSKVVVSKAVDEDGGSEGKDTPAGETEHAQKG